MPRLHNNLGATTLIIVLLDLQASIISRNTFDGQLYHIIDLNAIRKKICQKVCEKVLEMEAEVVSDL